MTSTFRDRVERERRFVRRAVHHPQLLRSRARRVLSTKVAFLETNHDASRSLLLVGSGRSGTTWMAEILTEVLRCRLVYEPLRVQSVPWTSPVRPGHYIGPDEDGDPAVAEVLDRILTGRIRSRFVDKYNQVRLSRSASGERSTSYQPVALDRPSLSADAGGLPPAPSGADRLVGDGPGLAGQAPAVPGAGIVDAGTARAFPGPHRRGGRLARPIPSGRPAMVSENYIPTEFLTAGHAHVVLYENMVDDPRGEVERLGIYLRHFRSAHWDLQMGAVDKVATRPSRSRKRALDITPGPDRLGRWVEEVPPGQVEKALALVRGFGLDRIYGTSTRPLIPADSVLRGRVGQEQ